MSQFEGLVVGEATPQPEGTPVTREALLAEGFKCFYDECTPEQLEKSIDPFFYYKGEFRIYDQLDEFYIVTGSNPDGKSGRRVETMERVKTEYEEATGRVYTKYEVLEDTAPIDLDVRAFTISKGFRKIRLHGGPGNGKTAVWPAVASFFIYQYTGENGRTEGARYQRKPGTKLKFMYVGPTN